MTIRLDGQVAIVTGAGNGLGKQYAMYLASLGATVVVNDLSATLSGARTTEDAAQLVVDEIVRNGGTAVASHDSVANEESAMRIARTAMEHYGRVDILIHNAGILRDRTLAKMSEEDFRQVMDVHALGAFFTVKAVLPHMMEAKYGRIVLTTSQSGLYGAFGQSNYAAAKMALVGLANAAKLELRSKGVLINCIAPSALTRMTESLMDEATAGKLSVDYVAPVVAYLCSRECKLSGEVLAAGGNHVALNRMVQAPGVNFGEHPPTADDIAASIDEIACLDGAVGFHSGSEHLKSLLQARSHTGDV